MHCSWVGPIDQNNLIVVNCDANLIGQCGFSSKLLRRPLCAWLVARFAYPAMDAIVRQNMNLLSAIKRTKTNFALFQSLNSLSIESSPFTNCVFMNMPGAGKNMFNSVRLQPIESHQKELEVDFLDNCFFDFSRL
jgi:hypothetical protein